MRFRGTLCRALAAARRTITASLAPRPIPTTADAPPFRGAGVDFIFTCFVLFHFFFKYVGLIVVNIILLTIVYPFVVILLFHGTKTKFYLVYWSI